MSTREEIQQMLSDIEQRESKLSDWERNFVQSISEQLGRGRTLTDSQDETLETIWGKVT